MKNSHLKDSLVAALIAVFAGVSTLGVNVALGEVPAGALPANTNLVAPTFSGLNVKGNIDLESNMKIGGSISNSNPGIPVNIDGPAGLRISGNNAGNAGIEIKDPDGGSILLTSSKEGALGKMAIIGAVAMDAVSITNLSVSSSANFLSPTLQIIGNIYNSAAPGGVEQPVKIIDDLSIGNAALPASLYNLYVSGNVGLGATPTANRLEVNGDIKANITKTGGLEVSATIVNPTANPVAINDSLLVANYIDAQGGLKNSIGDGGTPQPLNVNDELKINSDKPLSVSGASGAAALTIRGLGVSAPWLGLSTNEIETVLNPLILNKDSKNAVEIGSIANNANFKVNGNTTISGLAGVGSRPVVADANGVLSIGAAATSLWNGAIAGNIYSANTGNVGIGTATPTVKLDVNGDAKVSGIIDAQGSIKNTLGNVNVNDSLSINPTGANGAETAIFNSNGLELKKYGILMTDTNAATPPVIQYPNTAGGTLSNVFSILGLGAKNLNIGFANDPMITLLANGTLTTISSKLNIGTDGVAGDTTIGTANKAATLTANNKIVVKNTGIVNGNDISGAGITIGDNNSASSVMAISQQDIDTYGNALYLNYDSGTPVILGAEANADSNSVEALSVNGMTVLRGKLKVTGSAGIGTTTPKEQLHVSSSETTGVGVKLLVENTAATGSPFAIVALKSAATMYGYLVGGASNDAWGLVNGLTISPGTNAQDIGFRTGTQLSGSGSGPSMIIKTSGNVGIGTTTPKAKLEVNGAIKITSADETTQANQIFSGKIPAAPTGSLTPSLLSDFGNGGNGLILQSGYSSDLGGIKITDDGAAIWGSGDTDLLRVIDEDNNVSRLVIKDGGNVGIGTTTPGAKLEVNGGSGSSPAINLYGPSSAGQTSTLNLIDTYNYIKATYGGNLALGSWYGINLKVNNGTDGMIINTDGTVVTPKVYSTGVTTGVKALYIDNTGKIGYNGSSQRFKENIKSLDDVSWLYSLRPVFYNYIEDKTKAKRYGLIAEEVDKINPAVVTRGNDGKIDTVFYEALISPIIKAIQDQKSEIDQLKAENAEIKAALCEIKPTLKLCR